MPDVSLQLQDSGKQVALSVGARIVVKLPENPGGTGYKWTIPEFDAKQLGLESDTFTSEAAGIGGGGTRQFVLVAKSPGKTELTTAKKRPWEDNKNAVEKFQLQVTVGDSFK